jgi:predicted acylesterase/phospholipase RssA/CRP-like cAMP-binding protein
VSDADRTLRATIERYFAAGSEEIDSILASLRPVHVDGGEWLVRQGDPGDALYFLIRGRMQVWVCPEGGGEAPETLLGEVVPGDSVGEVSLLTGAARSAGVRAIRDSDLVAVNRAEFEALARRHPTLALQLASRVASVLRDRTTRVAKCGTTFRTIAVVKLGLSDRVLAFGSGLAAALRRYGSTLWLSPESLGERGAPSARLEPTDAVRPELRHWLHEQEDAYRFLVYECAATPTPWATFAMQQSDLVLLLADVETDSREPGAEEAAVAAATGASTVRRVLVLLHPSSSKPIVGTEAWLRKRRVDFHLHVRADQDEELARVARIISGNAIGLVLASGAARGFAHLGVYKAMREAGIRPDWVGGTSVGAIMGACVAEGWEPDTCIGKLRDAFATANPFGDLTIPVISLVRGRRLERILRQFLPERIEDLPIPFYAVSCNLDSGALNLHEAGPLPEALRASASMAGVMPPAVFDKQLTIDGSVLNSMPVDIMQTKPVGRVIAVDLASRKSHAVSFTSMPSPWAVLRGRLLPFFRKVRVPTLMTLMLKATELGTLARVRELGGRADLLLHPPVREFGMLDIHAYDRIVDAGYQYAKAELAKWKSSQTAGGEHAGC